MIQIKKHITTISSRIAPLLVQYANETTSSTDAGHDSATDGYIDYTENQKCQTEHNINSMGKINVR